MSLLKRLTVLLHILKGARIGEDCQIAFGARLWGVNMCNLVLGDNIIIGRRSWIGHLEQGKISIGDNTVLGGDIVISEADNICIGEGVLTSFRVTLVDHNHNFIVGKSPVFSGIDGVRAVSIGDNCFIGANSVICAGVRLGKGCVVGANSVVTHSFPADSMIGGNPARLLKKL